jgi:hypothetical protein
MRYKKRATISARPSAEFRVPAGAAPATRPAAVGGRVWPTVNTALAERVTALARQGARGTKPRAGMADRASMRRKGRTRRAISRRAGVARKERRSYL